jgi:hypothetical protein
METNKHLEIYSPSMSHQNLHTSDLEHLSFPILINQDKSLFMQEEAVLDSYIDCFDSGEIIPVHIVDIQKTHQQNFNNKTFFGYLMDVKLAFSTEDYYIQCKEAKLVLKYHDDISLTLKVGTIDYAFKPLDQAHLYVHDRINLSHKIDEVPSSMGMVLSLENKSMHAMTIDDIALLSETIKPNMSALMLLDDLDTEKQQLTDYFNELIYLDKPSSSIKPLIINPYEEAIIAVPFSYLDHPLLLHRYAIKITYTLNGLQYEAYFDEFTFIKTYEFLDTGGEFYAQGIIHQD